ncbi:hypothetical protein EDB85DRAFT_1891789 [Lactarius pseudohatsudake]|nr:hypothetical protein EDB85DRAFT_1891789 [Lactarius pseudohatsudake]
MDGGEQRWHEETHGLPAYEWPANCCLRREWCRWQSIAMRKTTSDKGESENPHNSNPSPKWAVLGTGPVYPHTTCEVKSQKLIPYPLPIGATHDNGVRRNKGICSGREGILTGRGKKGDSEVVNAWEKKFEIRMNLGELGMCGRSRRSGRMETRSFGDAQDTLMKPNESEERRVEHEN